MASKSIKITEDLSAKTITQLKKVCRDKGIPKVECDNVKKADLIRLILDKQATSVKKASITIGAAKKTKVGAKKTVAKKVGAKKTSTKTVKAAPAKKAPAKKASAKKVVAKKAPSKSQAKSKSSAKKVTTKKVAVKKTTKKVVKKAPAVKKTTKKVGVKKTTKKVSAKKTSVKSATSTQKSCKPDSCPEGVCELDTGKCIKKTSKMRPYGEAALKKRIGDDYEYDETLSVLGSAAAVAAYRQQYGVKSPKVKTPTPKVKTPKVKTPTPKVKTPKVKTPKKKAKKRCDDKEDFVKCKDGDVCSADTGDCVSASARKSSYELKVDGRIIIGSKESVTGLQKILGGDISGPVDDKGKGKAHAATPEASDAEEEEVSVTAEGLEEKIDEILAEDDDAKTEALRKEKERLTKKSGKKSPVDAATSPKTDASAAAPKVSSGKADIKMDEIHKAFQQCLASVGKGAKE